MENLFTSVLFSYIPGLIYHGVLTVLGGALVIWWYFRRKLSQVSYVKIGVTLLISKILGGVLYEVLTLFL
jgi:hypothetical protein